MLYSWKLCICLQPPSARLVLWCPAYITPARLRPAGVLVSLGTTTAAGSSYSIATSYGVLVQLLKRPEDAVVGGVSKLCTGCVL